MPGTRVLCFAVVLCGASAWAQQGAPMAGMKMPAGRMPGMEMQRGGTMTQAAGLMDAELQHASSGTSIEPPATPMHMLITELGGWRLMLHGVAFVAGTQQQAGSDRGGDKLFSTNWVMPMAQRDWGPGQLTVRAMLSLEPATISGGYYPELFQQGETAGGKAIVDGQHPHDFVMELAALYDVRLGEKTLLSVYAAPVGDPALGPTAYPHRFSASEDPLAALGHHQEDSTHIAFNVVTAGVTEGPVRVEVSGFHGAEPDEARWHLQPSPNGVTPDSYATRVTVVPGKDWAAQYSIGHLASPEALEPGVDQRRQTASVMYTRETGVRHDRASMPGMDMASAATGSWATTALWGQTKSLATGAVEDSYLVESLRTSGQNAVFTRIEVAARTSELLREPVETVVGHVQAYTLGYDRDFKLGRDAHWALGAQFTAYRAPDALAAAYGRVPYGAVAFVRVRLGR